MFCKNCGTQLPEGAAFCGSCGTAQNVQQAAPAYEEPVYNAQPCNEAPVYNNAPVSTVDDKSLMIKGILAIALSEFGIPGIILGSMAKKMAAQFVAERGQLFGKAKVGAILGKVGFGLGIGMTIFWGIYIVIYSILLAALA